MKNRVAYFGVFTALALIFSYVETLIPINFGIPGVKLGLANLVIVIALYKMKLTEVYLLSVVRVLLSGFIFGNYFSIIYSLAGGLLSLTVMALLKKSKGFSVMGISVAGGVFHNVGQLIVAMLVVETFSVGYYFPVLLVAGLITGLVIGIVSAEMLKRIKNIQFDGGTMITYIRGILEGMEEDKVIVDVGGVGYGIYMAGTAMGRLPALGKEVKIHTYLHVKEDLMQLYGFLTRDELRVFRLLIGVSGIGPKGGLGILSALGPDDLRFAVASNDVKAIQAAPGIGKKTAEKLILELKDKLKLEDALENTVNAVQNTADTSAGMANEMTGEAVQALVALGYGNTEALKAVRQVEITEEMSVEDVLRQSLKYML